MAAAVVAAASSAGYYSISRLRTQEGYSSLCTGPGHRRLSEKQPSILEDPANAFCDPFRYGRLAGKFVPVQRVTVPQIPHYIASIVDFSQAFVVGILLFRLVPVHRSGLIPLLFGGRISRGRVSLPYRSVSPLRCNPVSVDTQSRAPNKCPCAFEASVRSQFQPFSAPLVRFAARPSRRRR